MPQLPPDALSPDERRFIREIIRRNYGLASAPLARAERCEEAAVRLRWRRWLRFGGGHDWRLLRRRMRAEGLRPSAVYQPIAANDWPAWADCLHELQCLARQSAGQPEALLGLLPDGAAAIPFAELLAPCLLLARQRLARHSPPLPATLLAPAALDGMALALLRRLSEIAGPCLLSLFDEQRQISPLLLALFNQAEQPPREKYQAFVRQQLLEGYRSLGERFPVCLRLLAELVGQWSAACGEFCSRLASDDEALRATLLPGEAGPLVAISATLSDPHADGRTVLKLTFADSRQLVYKPRAMAMEAIFARSLNWLNRQRSAAKQQHRVAEVLDCGTHGWMAWIASAAMSAGEEAAYHWRLGSLMGCFRALRGADLHFENLVAAGPQPVFIDVECLLHPSTQPFLEAPRSDPAPHLPRELFAMGILPFYGASANGQELVNLGGIGKKASLQGGETRVFSQINSDWMVLAQAAIPHGTEHQPRTAAGPVNSLAWAKAIAAGYADTLTLLLSRRDWLLDAASSPWHGLSQARGRHLARNTWNYGVLMQGAVNPEAMSDGVMFDLGFDALHRHLHQLSPGFRAMLPAERRDLRRLDVPRFGFVADSQQIFDAHDQPLGVMYPETPYQSMRRGLLALTPQRVIWEAELIPTLLAEHTPPAGQDLPTLTADLCRRQHAQTGQAPLWLGLGYLGDGLNMRPLPPGLYNGSAGLALALAAAGQVLDCPATRQLAGATLAGIVPLLRPSAGLAAINLGYDQGLAGLLHALQVGGQLSGQTALSAASHELARKGLAHDLLAAPIPAAASLDLLNGLAGIVLVLLRLHRLQADASLLAAARHGGEHLLRQARPQGAGLTWAKAGEYGLSGLSHGGSGFALALAALYRVTADRRYRAAAFAALAHEAGLFVGEWGNWRDVRGLRREDFSQSQRQGCSWCHGAPGIALARAALLNLLADDLSRNERAQLTQELDIALATTLRTLENDQGPPFDDLCCGSAGSIDILLECARLLDRPALKASAHQAAARRRARWASPGAPPARYWFAGKDMAGSDIGLFKGIAGEVYLQARLSDPERIPCVLLPL